MCSIYTKFEASILIFLRRGTFRFNNNKNMLLKDYLMKIYIYHIQKKTYKFIDSIVIYVDNKKVYKVLLRYDERHKTALKKLNIKSPFKFVQNPPEIVIEDELIMNDKHERLTVIYNRKDDSSNVVVGEKLKICANH